MSDPKTVTEVGYTVTPLGCGALALALSKAQKAFPAVTKTHEAKIETRSGPGFTYTYANLADILEAVRGPLADNELAVIQPIVSNGEGTYVRTVLMHSSGESCEGTYPIPGGLTAQQMGSAITFGRRYSLTSLLGIATEDDDGAAATSSGKAPKASAKKAAKEEPLNQDTPQFKRQKEIMDLPAALGLTVEQAQAVWKDVVGTNVGIVDASPENLDQFEQALRGTAEAQAAAFGTEQN